MRSRFKDGQRENLAMEMQRNVAAQLFGKIFENLTDVACSYWLLLLSLSLAASDLVANNCTSFSNNDDDKSAANASGEQ